MSKKTKKTHESNEVKIIAVFNQKGGCAKTMTSMQLGGAISLKGYKVLVVDLDPQGTASMWAAQSDENDPFPADVISLAPMREKMIGEVQKQSSKYDLIVLDCPPAIDSSIPWAALNIADLGIIPVIPVMDNVWASIEAKKLAKRATEENSLLQIRFLLSQVRRGKIFDECVKIIAADEEVMKLDSMLTQRNAFSESQAYGTTVHSLSRKSPATKEVDALAVEVLKLLGIGEKNG